MSILKLPICWIIGHKWNPNTAKGYQEIYCDRCECEYYFDNPEDSPQGRGKLT